MQLRAILLAVVAPLSACDKGPSSTPAPLPTAAASTAPPGTAQATATPGATPTAAAIPGTVYGEGVKLPVVTTVDEILADPKKFAGKPVRVEGLVTDVCPKRGCWFEIAGDKSGQKLRFKVVDGVMTFPMEAKGGFAVAEGVLAVRDLTLEETRAQAEYQAKEYGIPVDPAAIAKPGTSIRIDGTGAVLRDKK